MAMNGIDISSYQKGLDINKVPADFVIIKATEGTTIDQSQYMKPWADAVLASGKKLGLYHFCAGGDPLAEADHFCKVIAPYVGKAILVLDYEQYGRFGVTNAKLWLDRVFRKTGVRALVYMSRSVCKEEDWSQIAPNHKLWVAQYPNYDKTGYQDTPWLPEGGFGAWKAPAIHQYTSAGRLPGYAKNLDLNKAHITAAEWDKIAMCDVMYAPVTPSNPTGTTLELVCAVMKGTYGTGESRKAALGTRYNEVQGMINHIAAASVETLRDEVIANKYGSGTTRKVVLGSRYDEVQKAVNDKLNPKVDLEAVAWDVISGKYGNGTARRQALQAAGYDPDEIQDIVNELL